MSDTVECPSCGRPNGSEQRFCGACGTSLLTACPQCGTDNPPSFRFCGGCGSALAAAGDESQQPAVEARRWVTVLFADLSGFTRASERMDPEDVTTLVDRCMRKLGGIVEKYGGSVEKIVGDQVMAVFGAPVAHEDDAERAVRAGLEMQACAREMADEFGGLQLRVGINTGEAMFAPVGPEGARRFTVMGDAVNTGSRLETAAAPGTVLVGEETYRAARRGIAFDEIEPFAAKNKEELVRAWRAVEPLATPAARKVSASTLVGRDDEVAHVTSIWRHLVQERRAHLVTIMGVPGIGKTRLADELAELAMSDGATVLRGRCLPYGEAVGYGAFVSHVKQAAGIFDNDIPSVARRKLEQAVGLLVDEEDVEELTGRLALLAGIDTDASADKPALFFSARRFVEALADSAPVVLVFEDIHWADPVLLDLIETLAARIRAAPVLLLCLARPELHDLRPQWGGGLPAFTLLPLEPLSDTAAATLVADLLGDAGDAEVSVEQLTAMAGGNPLFMEELIASVVEGAAAPGEKLPTSIRAIIAARLDALPSAARAALLDAAVVGKHFWASVLERLGPGDVRASMDLLEARDFIRREPRSRFVGDEEFTFRHILTRDVAYSTIPKAARRDRHRAVAHVLEATAGDRADASAAILAHHFREAGDTTRAAAYLERAAEASDRTWAKQEAIQLCGEALALIPESDVEWRHRIQMRRAELLHDGGDMVGAVAEIDAMLPTLEGAQRLRALLLRSRSAFWMADLPAARASWEAARALADVVGDDVVRGAVVALEMQMASADGRLEDGVEIGERALPLLSHEAVERRLVVTHLGLQRHWVGDHHAGVEHSRAGYELGLEHHDVEAALTAGGNYGMSLAALGRHSEAFLVFDEVLAHGREIELVPRLTGRVLSMWAGALRELCDFDAARDRNAQARELGERAAFMNTQVQTATDFLLLDLAAGELGAVQARLPGAMEQAEALKGWHQWLVTGRLADVAARLQLALGDHEAAASAAIVAIHRATAVGRAKYEASGRTVLARALTALGRFDDAVTEARQALTVAGPTRHGPTIAAAADALTAVLLAVGDDDGAASAHAQAGDALRAWIDGADDEQRARFLASEPTRQILDRAR